MEPRKPKQSASLTSKAGVLAVSRAITVIAQMVSMMVLTRTLQKEEFGILTFVLLILATAINLSHLGLAESIFYFFERVSNQARKTFILVTVRSLFLVGLGACLLLVLINVINPPFWKIAEQSLVFPLLFLILTELTTLPLPNALIAIDEVKAAGSFNICAGLSQFAALVVPALLGYPITVIVHALMAYGALRLLLAAWLFLKYFRGSPEVLPSGTVKQQFEYSIPVGISQILWGLNRQIDKFIVWAFLPVTVYAEYVVGSWEIPFIPAIAYSVSAVIMPKLVNFHAKTNTEELLSLWFRAIKKVSLLVLPLAVLFLISAEEFIATFFSEDYLPAALPFRIYTIIIFQRVAAYSSMFKALGETKIIYRSALYLVGINLALSFPLVFWLGMAGPALATLAANLFTWGYSLNRMSGALQTGIGKVFPFGYYGKALALAVLAAIPALILKIFLSLAWLPMLALLTASYLVTYFLLMNAAGFIKLAEWRQITKVQ